MKLLHHLLLLLFMFGMSQGFVGQDLETMMRARDEYYFSVKLDSPHMANALARLVSIDQFDGETAICYANEEQYRAFLAKGYHPTLMTPPSMLEEAVMYAGNTREGYEWDAYPTYEAYESMMQEFAETYPERCTLLTLGTLESGRKIMVARLHNGSPEGKPKFLYSSTMHGDETTGYVLMLRFIDYLLTSEDPEVQHLMDSLDIFICPNANPDGTYFKGNNSVTGGSRNNAHRVDLNRNYKDFDDGDHPDGKEYALETQWFMQLADDYPFTMGANYHGGAEVANYPWDTYQPVHPDDDWWQHICTQYANTVKQQSSTYFCYPYASGITNGYAWYTISGSRQDYMNYYAQCRELTLECSRTKCPNASTLPLYWTYNKDAMLQLLHETLNGIHGLVTDEFTGTPLEADITIEGHDHHGSSVSSHAPAGDFHRPIKGGTYTLTFSKEGYQSKTAQVSVADGGRVDLQVALTPLAATTIHDTLCMGWNWFTPCLEASPEEGLDLLLQALGSQALYIKSNNDFLQYDDETGWEGGLTTISPEKMYMIQTRQECPLQFFGYPLNPANHPITLNVGWNWLGFPCNHTLPLDEVFSEVPPCHGDIIKSHHQFATYIQGYGWFGSLSTLKPGQGYLYLNTGDKPITFTYPSE